MAKRKEKPWQFKVTFALTVIMLFCVFGYFTQSFLEIRKVKPVRVAIERMTATSEEADVTPETAPKREQENSGMPEQ